MSDDANPVLAKCAIEEGAFLFVKKPVTQGLLSYIWQCAFKDKVRKYREECLRREQFIKANNLSCTTDGKSSGQSTSLFQRKRSITSLNIENRNGVGACYNNKHKRTRMCTSWTLPLHRRFIDAIKELGETRCYPREIVRLMNVPGVTTMQISSHLQRCRLGWQHPEDRDAPPLIIPRPHSVRLGARGLFSSIGTSTQSLLPGEVIENVVYEMTDESMIDSTPTPGSLKTEHNEAASTNNNLEKSRPGNMDDGASQGSSF